MSLTVNAVGSDYLAKGGILENRQLYNVLINALIPDSEQPRKYFDDSALEELKVSIERHGVLQPVIFRKDDQGQFLLVSGERRFRASQLVGKESIPAIYNEGENTSEIALVENLLRENLTPIEEAEALLKLKEEQSYSHEQLSAVIGKAISTISEILSLNKLPEEIKAECRTNPKYSRRALVEVAKKETEKEKMALFDKLKKNELKSDAVRAEAKTKVALAVVWEDKIKKFRKAVEAVKFENLGEGRESVEKNLRSLAESILAKLPAA